MNSLTFMLIFTISSVPALAMAAVSGPGETKVPQVMILHPVDTCDESTRDQISCIEAVAERANVQLDKDWNYLWQLANSRNQQAARLLSMGHLAFRSYLQKNCESEGHDALGGTLQDVLELQCRRETILSRRRLFQKIGEAHPLGRAAESKLGRPVCATFTDTSMPVEIGTAVKLKDADELRKRLDMIGARAARDGIFNSEIKKILRASHTEAERLRGVDAHFTCLGIVDGFCQQLAENGKEEIRNERDLWLSRCQTEIRSAFYKRATKRLRDLSRE